MLIHMLHCEARMRADVGLMYSGRVDTRWIDRKPVLSSHVAEKLLIPRPDGIAGQIGHIYPFRRDVVDVLLIKVCP